MAAAYALSSYEYDRSLEQAMSLREEFMIPLVNNLIFAVLTPILFRIALRNPIQKTTWKRRLSAHILGSVGFTIAHVVLRSLIYPVYNPEVRHFVYVFWDPHTLVFETHWLMLKRLFFYNLTSDIFSYYFPIVLIAQAVWYARQSRERAFRAIELEAQLAKARLQTLKSQLQPHFLFNTLHSISALMLTDVQAADKMMTRLSDLLRMSLENSGVQETTLSRELEFVSGYLEIEKVRFEERLDVVFDIAPEALDARVPHLLLQPLVENSVRHGISRHATPGEIVIGARHDGDSLYLRVTDNGPGLRESTHPQNKSGLGLITTRERLRTLYGDAQRFEIRSLPGGGVEVSVQLPFQLESDSEALPEKPQPAA